MELREREKEKESNRALVMLHIRHEGRGYKDVY
jgi:hypothetical protein